MRITLGLLPREIAQGFIELLDQAHIGTDRLRIAQGALPPAEGCRVHTSVHADPANGEVRVSRSSLDVGNDGLLIHTLWLICNIANCNSNIADRRL